jgi:hypothetical protein
MDPKSRADRKAAESARAIMQEILDEVGSVVQPADSAVQKLADAVTEEHRLELDLANRQIESLKHQNKELNIQSAISTFLIGYFVGLIAIGSITLVAHLFIPGSTLGWALLTTFAAWIIYSVVVGFTSYPAKEIKEIRDGQA